MGQALHEVKPFKLRSKRKTAHPLVDHKSRTQEPGIRSTCYAEILAHFPSSLHRPGWSWTQQLNRITYTSTAATARHSSD